MVRRTDFFILLETAVDNLEYYQYKLFATYFDPSLLDQGELLEITVERTEEAKLLWARLGQQVMVREAARRMMKRQDSTFKKLAD